MRVPLSTYRLQLNSGFPFAEAVKLLPYLRSLGVETVYCSPVLRSKSGSVHCYDVTDHSEVNPELGGATMLESLSSEAKKLGMGLLLDIVPNHMSTSPENASWMDVLENGEASAEAGKFDIDWDPPSKALAGKVLLPVLPTGVRAAVMSGLIRLAADVGGRPVSVLVGDAPYPLSPETVGEALRCLRRAGRRGAVPAQELLGLLSRQHYVFAKWTEADTRVNYRRFLNVNELVAIRVEDPGVFEETHRVVSGLLRGGAAVGIRVDHADGLRDPAQYFSRLRRATGGAYVVAEKILTTRKRVPLAWDVDGTTGYEFLNEVNRLLIKSENERALERVYRRFTGAREGFAADVREGKLLAMKTMRGESRRLAGLLREAHAPRASLAEVERAVRTVASNMDGYRTYISPRTRRVRKNTRGVILRATEAARREKVDPAALRAVEDALLLRGREKMSEEEKRSALEFVLRFQQFTAAVAVKGEEDTALYRYVKLTSMNVVGGVPTRFGERMAEFHSWCVERGRRRPGSMNTTSTHDTKRSEDVRARIDVLSEMPEEWGRRLERWHALTLGRGGPARGAPSKRDEYLFYQTAVGAWPGGRAGSAFVERMSAYMLKATREEREETSWASPDLAYEREVDRFLRTALKRGSAFARDMEEFVKVVGWYGALNSLTQTLLRVTAPGVPDTYQGNEVMDYSLVDPDNRRPVDYGARARMLQRLDSALTRKGEAGAAALAASGLRSGLAKLYVTAVALRSRRGSPLVFAEGRYTPLKGAGERRGNVVAFVRAKAGTEFLVCAPRHFTELAGPGELPLGRGSWGETRLSLPAKGAPAYRDVLTGRSLTPNTGAKRRYLMASDVFSAFPVALLKGTSRV